MLIEIIKGLSVPFIGTTLGAFCVFFLKNELGKGMQKALTGFAAGVMIAASIWSLLLPAIEQGASLGVWRFIPAAIGFWIGILFLMAIDYFAPPECIEGEQKDNLLLAVTLHNIPEGMAVGVALAAAMEHSTYLPMAGALALSLGIAIQNFPEGAIVSMPLRSEGNSRLRAFGIGTLSGVVEPIGAILTILLAAYITPILPYLLSFAAGAMIYVVVEELIPEASQGKHSNVGTVGFALGFVLMMILDVVLG